MSHVPLRARIADLAPDEQTVLKRWYAEGIQRDEGQRCGLWVFGPRRHGTSYVAQVAMARLVQVGFEEWEHVHALALTETIRRYWNQSDLVRKNADDYGLFLEMQNTEVKLERLWYEAAAVWVDDFHEESVDVQFWRKHVQPHLERRCKDGKPTIVATTLPPSALVGLQQVIEDLFFVCPALIPVKDRQPVKPYDEDSDDGADAGR